MGNHYRRTISPQSAVSAEPDASDPYVAYMNWLANGKPTMSGGPAVRPEAGTVLLSEHIQVQEHSGLIPTEKKPSAWKRLVSAFRR